MKRAVIIVPLGLFALATTFRLLLINIIIIIIRTSYVKVIPNLHKFQVVPCFWPVFGPIRHVEKGAKQTLAHVFRDMHDIKAMGRVEDLPVWQIPENRPRFTYLQQWLGRLSLLSQRWALWPICQQLIDFVTAPQRWLSSELNFPIEQIFASSPRVILAKPPSMPNEHGFEE
jgi:hypothetical protein